MVKIFKTNFIRLLRNQKADDLETWYTVQHRVLKYCQISSNDDTGLTLTIFITWSNLFSNVTAWVKANTAYNISKLVLIQHFLCTQVSNTGPMVLWFINSDRQH